MVELPSLHDEVKVASIKRTGKMFNSKKCLIIFPIMALYSSLAIKSLTMLESHTK